MGRKARRRQRDVQAVTSFVHDHGSTDRPVPDLVRLVARRAEADAAVAAEVHRLHRAGASWTVIGRALGVSRQAARQRYGEHSKGAGEAS